MTNIMTRNGKVLKREWPGIAHLISVGIYVAVSMLFPVIIGLWFDTRTPQDFPVYTVLGLTVGTVLMVYGVYRIIGPYVKKAMQHVPKKVEKIGEK
ncbi:MAG: AtpZ/AtpI family protein [bacterium]|nr:AtpZ/AtpI family protein [bacterium]